MAVTPSRMVALGTTAPPFSLAEPLTGKTRSLDELRSDKGTLVMFICNHCPFVVHVNPGLVALAKDYLPKGIALVAINSNNVETHPDDSPDKMAVRARELGYPFPYLFDRDQSVARAYDARCTPDFFLYDGALRLAYRGQLDGSRPGNSVPVTGEDLRKALDAVLAGLAPDPEQRPSAGCNIKWRPGNEPH